MPMNSYATIAKFQPWLLFCSRIIEGSRKFLPATLNLSFLMFLRFVELLQQIRALFVEKFSFHLHVRIEVTTEQRSNQRRQELGVRAYSKFRQLRCQLLRSEEQFLIITWHDANRNVDNEWESQLTLCINHADWSSSFPSHRRSLHRSTSRWWIPSKQTLTYDSTGARCSPVTCRERCSTPALPWLAREWGKFDLALDMSFCTKTACRRKCPRCETRPESKQYSYRKKDRNVDYF